MFKEKIIEILVKETSLKKEELEEHIENPPSLEFGDYALPCFIFSRKYLSDNTLFITIVVV